MSLPISRSSSLFVHPRILHLFLELFRQSCSSPYPSPVSSPRSLASLSPSRLTPMSIFPYRLIRKESYLSRRPAWFSFISLFPSIRSFLYTTSQPSCPPSSRPLPEPGSRRCFSAFHPKPAAPSSRLFVSIQRISYIRPSSSATYLRD